MARSPQAALQLCPPSRPPSADHIACLLLAIFHPQTLPGCFYHPAAAAVGFMLVGGGALLGLGVVVAALLSCSISTLEQVAHQHLCA